MTQTPGTAITRRRAVDAARGLAMVVMVLDHVRDFLGHPSPEATDLAVTTMPLFGSRWITHFCAPTFFLLAGTSAYLAQQTGARSARATSRFLIVRGLALVVVEQTALRCLGWYFHADYHFMNAGVLYGLGFAMVLLAGLIWLPPRVTLVLGLAIILGEAALARLQLGPGALGTLVALATQSRDFEPFPGYHFYVSYPPVPWLGVMAFGYGLADLVYGRGKRRAWLVGLGAAFLALFVIVRGLNVLDPEPWSAQATGGFTVLSFLNVSKYPPSTPFLLLTLAGAMLALAAFERWPGAGRLLETYGKVPLFFYLIHIPLIHLLAVGYAYAAFGAATWLLHGPVIFWDHALPGSPPSYGFALAGVWLIWAALVAALYPACRWYANRARRRSVG